MTPAATTPRRTEPRERILEAAAEVFAERGFAGAGVDEIAQRAGVNKAMLYYHVGDKATLFREVVVGLVRAVKAEIERAVAHGEGPSERLAAVPMAFARVASSRPYFPEIMLREVAAGGAHLPDEMLVEITGVLAHTRGVVEAGKRRGGFRDVNPVLVHLMLVGSMLFIANATRMRKRIQDLQPLPRGTPVDLVGAAKGVADIVLHGVVSGTRKSGGRS